MNRELPQMTASSYASQTTGGAQLLQNYNLNIATPAWNQNPDWAIDKLQALQALGSPTVTQPRKEVAPMAAKAARRLVKVIIVDPNENVPLDQCVLYSGDEKMTDLDDNELFFDLDIKALLTVHNERRTKIVDKTVKDRTAVEYLEPARIRDLKMTVVTIAGF